MSRRFIDADKLEQHLKGEIEGCNRPVGDRSNGKSIAYGTALGLKMALSFVETLSTADVVEVVRCKDCKFAEKRPNGEFDCRHPHTPWATDEYAVPCQAEDFCSYGERREENEG